MPRIISDGDHHIIVFHSDQRHVTHSRAVDARHGYRRGQPDLGQFDVERLAIVVERGGLQDDAGRPHQHGHGEDPQEEAVEHHGHVLPVFNHLK